MSKEANAMSTGFKITCTACQRKQELKVGGFYDMPKTGIAVGSHTVAAEGINIECKSCGNNVRINNYDE